MPGDFVRVVPHSSAVRQFIRIVKNRLSVSMRIYIVSTSFSNTRMVEPQQHSSWYPRLAYTFLEGPVHSRFGYDGVCSCALLVFLDAFIPINVIRAMRQSQLLPLQPSNQNNKRTVVRIYGTLHGTASPHPALQKHV